MPVLSNTKFKLLGVVKLNLYIRVVCLLCASLMATLALSQDLSGWSDKTVCRVAKATPDNTEYQTELTKRGLSCGGSAATSSNTFEMQNPDKYCSSVILPNDVASAKKYTVCLFDKTALKEYLDTFTSEWVEYDADGNEIPFDTDAEATLYWNERKID